MSGKRLLNSLAFLSLSPIRHRSRSNVIIKKSERKKNLVFPFFFLFPHATPERSTNIRGTVRNGALSSTARPHQGARCSGIKTSSAREIAASITRLVRSETRDLVGRPCVPTPVAPLNNTTQPYVCIYACECPRESPCESSAKYAARNFYFSLCLSFFSFLLKANVTKTVAVSRIVL